MSNNLTKIREMVSGVKKSLASMTINPDALDEIDSVASQRVMLREKLVTLEAAETAERERIVAEEIKQKGKKRRAALVELAEQSEKLVAEHTELTEEAVNIINDLVSVLIKRESVFTREKTGLNKPVFRELFTNEEYKDLTYEMNRSAIQIYSGDFAATFHRAVDEQIEGENMARLRNDLRSLVKHPERHNAPIKGANTLLVKRAKSLQFQSIPESESSTPYEAVKPEPEPGYKEEANLRPSAKQKKQKKYNPHTGLVESV